ncbi:unnamed protein product [Candida verbasci]|uniref:Translocon Sec61/SecY plug domain-containing protein n=1 Tax=Candida verbasci TaxID=1227364 RepID=A0A9W4TX05_9ASCO|nr:unnamed protein product [Candida verbasci]
MAGFRLLDLVKFFLPILPEIEYPFEKISFDERIVYTVSCAVIFLFGQLPIYGLKKNAQFYIEDPFYNFRSIFSMQQGTLLEFGLLPVLTSGFIWQIAVGLRLINVNLGNRLDRELFQTGQKLTSFILAIIYTVIFIYVGYFDNVIKGYNPIEIGGNIPWGSYFLIGLQLCSWSWIITLLVEIFDKGYGFGSGSLCFLILESATNFIADLVGVEIYPLVNSNKFETYGASLNLIKNFKIFSPKETAFQIYHAFTRIQFPNLTQFYISLFSILVVIGLQNFRIEVPIRSTKMRGMNNIYPIKLLYCGALPLLFAYTIIANLKIFNYLFNFALSPYFPTLTFKLYGSRKVLNSTIISFAFSIIEAFAVIILSSWFANKWSFISGSSPRDISKQFKDQGISISGKRDVSITKEFNRIIPVASVSGAFIIAVVAVIGEFFGGLGKGVSVIVGVASAFGILEEFMIEYQQAGGSQFTNALSGFQ